MEYEEHYVEPESAISFGDNFKVEAKMLLNTEELDAAIAKYVREQTTRQISMLEETLKKRVQAEVKEAFDYSYKEYSLEKVMKQVVEEKFNEKYPDIVENKVNDFASKIGNMKFDDMREFSGRNFQESAMKKVNAVIDSQLAEVIKKTKEGIDDYAKNYFARNLFKAMNLMDGLIGDKQEKLS